MHSFGWCIFWIIASMTKAHCWWVLEILLSIYWKALFFLIVKNILKFQFILYNEYSLDKISLCSCSMEFLSRPASTDGPLVAFGGSDGMIRVLSMLTWKVSHFLLSSAYIFYFWLLLLRLCPCQLKKDEEQ